MANSIGERLRAIGARYPVDETLVFGLDVGIASAGSAVVRYGDKHGTVEFVGSWCFEAPEEPKTKVLKNKTRRDARLARRVIRRRARRMADVRALLAEADLLESTDPAAFHNRKRAAPPDPWAARANGLDRRLSNAEFAAALLHIAKHRGFKSNRKSDASQNAPDDNKKMLGAIASNKELLGRYRTVGEMVAKEAKFATQKRNKGGQYAHTFSREDLQNEAEMLVRRQRELGNNIATEELRARYIGIAFHQRGLQDSEHMVGLCPFEASERRSPRHAPSFEKFRFLAKINTIKVREPDGSLRRLKPEELSKATADFGVGSKSVTWKALATKIGLPKGVFFDGIDDRKAKSDVAASRGCAFGTKTLFDVLGPAGRNAVRDNLELLDAAASVIAFREDIANIEAGLREIDGLEPLIVNALMDGVRRGDFSEFKGAGHISAKAARNLLPHLLEAKVYSEACAAHGYDHAQARKVELDDIANPVVRRSLREAIKQVETLIHHFGARPGRIVVELAREVGKSAKERDEITRGLEKRTAEKRRRAEELKQLLGLSTEPSDEDVRRYELWKEQNCRCIYTDKEIPPKEILASSNMVQVDHILPRSLSQDNSYTNQVLCFAKANQDKGQKTPWEWKGRHDAAWWTAFEARVRGLKIKGIKKRNLLMRDFDERQQDFAERNLNDTKYAARALLAALRELYGDEGEPDPASEGYLSAKTKRRLFARPGAITAILRRAWGLDGIKDRADDRHHALDALVCAAGSNEWLLNRLTRAYQRTETENRAKWVPNVPEPWPGFRNDAIKAYEGVFVARSEKRRGRGQGHKDTIYAATVEDGKKVTYERKAVTDLSKSDLARLKDADAGNKPLAEALSAWVEHGKPADDPPKSPNGDVIQKVQLKRSGASGFDLNGDHVDNADMVRVDVFAKLNKKSREEFYLVPVYRRHVMDRRRWPQPPNRAIIAYKPENEWALIDETHEFRFSLYPDSYIEVVKRDGEVFEGYYRSTDRSTGAISLSHHNLRDPMIRGIGAKTLNSFRKLHIDRLGRKHEITREIRTWRGVDCT